MATGEKLILVTGATGYVGGRLVPRLLEAGYQVRCLVRDPARMHGYDWLDQVEVIQADVLDFATLPAAMKDVHTAYYLIQGVKGRKINPERDCKGATNFVQAAEAAKVKHIIYLGELANQEENLSTYLQNRLDIGKVLRDGEIPTTEFRAGMIVGAGSALFELIRYITEREPVLICPSWFYTLAQPISIKNALEYLVAALEVPESTGQVIEIGGPTRLTYADMLREYANERDFKRLLIRTPVNAPRLSAYWVHLVTPIHWRMVLPLIEGLNAESLVTSQKAKELFPDIQLQDYRSSVKQALESIRKGEVETFWSDALVSSAGDIKPYRFSVEKGMYIERRYKFLELPINAVYKSYTGIGGERGWLYMDWAWTIRGWIDKIVGGVGLRRGRRHPDEIRVGEALDFWRVEEIVPNRSMLLRAEMITPGRSWLEFRSDPHLNNKTLLSLGAYFAPRGLAGVIYWYLLYPFHKFIFDGMIRNLAKRAEEIAAAQEQADE